jgi:hypothetical protein
MEGLIVCLAIFIIIIWITLETLKDRDDREAEEMERKEAKVKEAEARRKALIDFKSQCPDDLLPGFRIALSNLFISDKNSIVPINESKLVCMNGHEWFFTSSKQQKRLPKLE